MYTDTVTDQGKNYNKDTSRDALYLALALFVAFMATGFVSARISQDISDSDADAYMASSYSNTVRTSYDKQLMKAEDDLNAVDSEIDSGFQELESDGGSL